MLLMGWDGTAVTPQIRSLIEEHHLGSIILTAKNLKCKHILIGSLGLTCWSTCVLTLVFS